MEKLGKLETNRKICKKNLLLVGQPTVCTAACVH
jgi:hypothetical protein